MLRVSQAEGIVGGIVLGAWVLAFCNLLSYIKGWRPSINGLAFYALDA